MRNSVSLDELIEFIVQKKNQIVGEHIIGEAMNPGQDVLELININDAVKTAENIAEQIFNAHHRGRLEGRALMLHDLVTFLENKKDEQTN